MLAQGQLSDVAASIHSCDGVTSSYIKTILLYNTNTSANTVSLYIVPSGGTSEGVAATSDQFVEIVLGPSETFEFSPSYPLVLSQQYDSLQAEATRANEVNYFVLGEVK